MALSPGRCSRGVISVFHYLPLHVSEMGRKFGGKPGDCPVTEYVSDRLLRLPFYTSITEREQAEVVAALRAFDNWDRHHTRAVSI